MGGERESLKYADQQKGFTGGWKSPSTELFRLKLSSVRQACSERLLRKACVLREDLGEAQRQLCGSCSSAAKSVTAMKAFARWWIGHMIFACQSIIEPVKDRPGWSGMHCAT